MTPILDDIQDHLYRAGPRRIETRELYIRIAIADAGSKPDGAGKVWDSDLCEQVAELGKLLKARVPPIGWGRIPVFTFGAFSFEFAHRAIGPELAMHYAHWGSPELGEAFRSAVGRFNPDVTNLFPLLHVTIARGKFIQAHEYFTREKGGNYFDFVSRELADRLIAHWDSPRLQKLWVVERERAAKA